ncbi:hypothetical protein RR48_00579 [Papilio machaon]|uniref:Uncharacterized protein n=1 Tax=Papilio machaon TaxID=76193 RepID=A0A0N0PF70_PAPMA|nr:hypothetical protein RR48_00579 [Papilio machaon]
MTSVALVLLSRCDMTRDTEHAPDPTPKCRKHHCSVLAMCSALYCRGMKDVVQRHSDNDSYGDYRNLP